MRYIVDNRVGCIAVRDSTKIDEDRRGLHGDEGDCVQFWMKRKTEVDGRVEFVSTDYMKEAAMLAGKLNMSPERYEELLDAEAKLDALEAAGVDNWCGYDEAF